MLTYNITKQERDLIEGFYFEKNAKENILQLFSSQDIYEIDQTIFDRVYNEAVTANIAFSKYFNTLMDKYVSKDIKYVDARVEFLPCQLLVEEV